jgi:hypothetical protein
MTHFAPEDLLQFLYKETSPETTAAILAALEHDWTLREKLAVLKAAHDRLQALVEVPRTESVLNILRYAIQTETSVQK